jgi:uncharacterized protein (TIGR03437 family)
LPTLLAGLRVKANGNVLPLLYVSDRQVNFQCPNSKAGDQLTFTVETLTGISDEFEATQSYAGPGIFTLDSSGKGQGAILLAGTNKIAMPRNAAVPSQPAQPGDYIEIYATGLGPIDHPVFPGNAAVPDPLSNLEAPIQVKVGDTYSEVTFAGLAPGFVGVYQVNVRLQASVQTGDAVPVTILITEPDGRVLAGNVVTISVESNR